MTAIEFIHALVMDGGTDIYHVKSREKKSDDLTTQGLLSIRFQEETTVATLSFIADDSIIVVEITANVVNNRKPLVLFQPIEEIAKLLVKGKQVKFSEFGTITEVCLIPDISKFNSRLVRLSVAGE